MSILATIITMSTMSTPQILPVNLIDVVEVLRPRTWPDVAALVFVCIVYAGFALRNHTWDKPDPLDYIFYERPQEKDGGQSANRKTRNIAHRLEELVCLPAFSHRTYLSADQSPRRTRT